MYLCIKSVHIHTSPGNLWFIQCKNCLPKPKVMKFLRCSWVHILKIITVCWSFNRNSKCL